MTREDLKKYRGNKLWIEEQIELYTEMKQRVEGLKAVLLDGMPKAKNKPNYAIENLIDKYNFIIEELASEQEELNKIILQLKRVEEPYREILTKFYIQGKKLVRVADEMNYTYDYTRRMNGIALDKFEKEAEKEETHKILQNNTL